MCTDCSSTLSMMNTIKATKINGFSVRQLLTNKVKIPDLYQNHEENLYFVHVLFCVYEFITLFSPLMESVYWFHSSPLHLCLFGSVSVDLSSLISVNNLSGLVCTSCSHYPKWSVLQIVNDDIGGIVYYKRCRKLTLIRLDRATGNLWL